MQPEDGAAGKAKRLRQHIAFELPLHAWHACAWSEVRAMYLLPDADDTVRDLHRDLVRVLDPPPIHRCHACCVR